MPAASKDYFVYLPEQRTAATRDGAVISAGYSQVPAGGDYPPLRHPMDHHFNRADGRILDSYTIVFITGGGGTFESAATPRKHRIEAGTVFVLFPGVWHRYAPDPKTGWVENWIECRGPAMDRARKAGLLNPKQPVLRIGLDPDLLHCFERCHSWAQRPAPGKHAVLATLCPHLLAVLEHAQTARDRAPQRIDEVIQRAQAAIAERYHEALSMERLAKNLGASYSHFRQAFKEKTGLSPKQYHTRIRLQKAQDFLANTAKSVKEIAELLGFDSAFHLSNQFKARTGLAPQPWRQRLHRRTHR